MNTDVYWKPDIIVLGPGGSKGYIQLGALLRLELDNLLSNVVQYVGCSVGAIISLLMVVGYSANDIINYMLSEIKS